MNTYLIGLGIGALIAVVGVATYKAEQYGESKVREQWSEERREWERQSAALRAQQQSGIDEAAQTLEKARNEKRIVYRTITQQIAQVVDRPVYLNNCVDERGLQLINDALAGRSTAKDGAKPDTALPAAGAAAGNDGRSRAAQAGGGRTGIP